MKREYSPAGDQHWLKIIVIYPTIEALGAGLSLAVHLKQQNLVSVVYFARYTTPPFRIEFQVLTCLSMQTLKNEIMAFRYFIPGVRGSRLDVRPLRIKFEQCTGSFAYGHAFEIVCLLCAQGQPTGYTLCDLVHWMFNMAGFSYVQRPAQHSGLERHSAFRQKINRSRQAQTHGVSDVAGASARSISQEKGSKNPQKTMKLWKRFICRVRRHDLIPTGRRGVQLREWECVKCRGTFVTITDLPRLLFPADARSNQIFEKWLELLPSGQDPKTFLKPLPT
jgi:hypothetical protein